MSDSNFTTAPNLGLYKPVAGADVGGWGVHLNANTDVLDSAFAGGPWLPLAGGTVTGATTFSVNAVTPLLVNYSPVVTGSTMPQAFYTNTHSSGRRRRCFQHRVASLVAQEAKITVLAGTIRASSSGNPDWRACDGGTVYVADTKLGGIQVLPRAAPAPGFGDHRDWRRRVGTKYGWTGLGPNGFRFRLPVAKDGNYVKTNDDTADT